MGILRIQGAEKITVNIELNSRGSVYCSQAIKMKKAPCGAFFILVAWGGIEPPTQGFSILCSTD
jgi:hypothetical protein